jgi:hypothetical protein
MVAWKAVEFSRDLGYQNIMMEGDVSKIAYALRRDGSYWSNYGHLMTDAEILLSSF